MRTNTPANRAHTSARSVQNSSALAWLATGDLGAVDRDSAWRMAASESAAKLTDVPTKDSPSSMKSCNVNAGAGQCNALT